MEALLQEERAERDERRGLETRATTLLAASIAAVGFVVSALSNAELAGLDRVAEDIGITLGTLLGLFCGAFFQLQLALRTKSPGAGERPGADARIRDRIVFHQTRVNRIEKKYVAVLRRLEAAIKLLSAGLLVLGAGLVWLVVVG